MSNTYALQQLMRWYGPTDPVQLEHIAQAGCHGVVSALHAIPVGEIWTKEAVQTHKALVEAKDLHWTVVESLPVHEDIKMGSGQSALYIENYKKSLANLAAYGIKVVTYNFMPVLDWVRTNIAYKLADGSETLLFSKADFAVFDLFLLKRPGAEKDYSEAEKAQYKMHFENLPDTEKNRLFKDVLLGLPGSEIPFTPMQVLSLLEQYQHIDRKQLKANLISFLQEITPIADELGIQLAIHPDDPPFSVLGLPRIMSTSQDIQDIIEAVPNKSNGLCFCTGSFGARADNDLVEMIQKWGSRVYFLHLRSTQRDGGGNFFEANHLEGNADIFQIMFEVVKLMHREQRRIPMRPDHGYKMLDDMGKKTYPGYSAIGRLKGLAELRGLEYGIVGMLQF